MTHALALCGRWHFFMGVSTYHGPVFMQYVRMEELQRKAEVQPTGFGLKTIVAGNPDDKAKKTL